MGMGVAMNSEQQRRLSKSKGLGLPSMMNRSPEWELITRVGEPRFRRAALFIDKSKPFEDLSAGPNALIAHE